MINKIKSYKSGLNTTFVLNTISTLLLQGISFITVPIFSRILGSAQYGLYAVFVSWTTIFSAFLSLNIPDSFVSGRFKFINDYENYRSNIIIFTLIVSTCTSMIVVALFGFINKIINYSFLLYVILVFTSLANNIVNAIMIILIAEKKALLKLLISLILSVTTVLLSLYFIFNANFGELYIARIIGHFVPYALTSLFLIYYILSFKKNTISLKYLKFGIFFGFPLIGHSLAGALLTQSDRLMMSRMNVLPSNIGIYSLYYSYTSIIGMILNSFNISFSPFYAEYIHKQDKKTMIDKSKNYIEVFTIICIGFLLLSREVSYFIASEEYYFGIELIPVFVSIKYFTFMYHFSANYEFYYGKTKFIAFGTILATIINIFLNYFLINFFGIYGAAIATLVASIFEYIFHYIISLFMKEKRFYITFKYFALPLLLFIIFIVLFYTLKDFVVARWGIGLIIGTYETYKIFKRKYIF